MDTPLQLSAPMQCPTCGAEQDWSAECRRCKADLSDLQVAWRAARRERHECLAALRDGEWERAHRHATRLIQLHPDDDARRLVAVSALMCEEWPAALRIARRMAGAE